jgi:glutaredoxin 3
LDDGDRAVAEIEIYTSPLCGFCHAARRLLADKAVDFTEIDVVAEPRRKAEMIERADGRRTVPQIFIDGRGIGGCDELYALERSGELDRLLAGAGS